MNTAKLFTYVKAAQILPAAGILYNTTAKNKMRGKDSSGNPTDFTADEKRRIELAFWKLTRDAGIEIRRDRATMKTPIHAKPKTKPKTKVGKPPAKPKK